MKGKKKTLEEEARDPLFQEWYLSLTIGFLLEEMEFEEMVDDIYVDSQNQRKREGKEPKGKVTVVKPSLSQCR